MKNGFKYALWFIILGALFLFAWAGCMETHFVHLADAFKLGGVISGVIGAACGFVTYLDS